MLGQIQDRLKGVPDQALVGYVENPTGNVPTYLALGELGRREEMRKKYKAQAQPTGTVAEEIVEETVQSNMPKGLGAMTNQMQAPMAPQEEVMTESITETGIANLPAPNIGQNYAGGGIIGMATGGGFIFDPFANGGKGGFVSSNSQNAQPFSKAGLPAVIQKTPLVPYTPPAAPAQPGFLKRLATGAGKLIPGIIKRNPYVAGGLGLAGLLGLTGGDDEEEALPVAPLPESMFVDTTPVDYTPEIDFSDMTIKDTAAYGDKMMEDHRARMGVDPFAAKRQERLAALEEDIGSSDDALNMALIRGGIGMASGTSDDFLTNLASGLGEGVDAYVAEDDKQAQQKMDLFALQSEIAAAERAEEVAIATTGTNSQATAEANNRKVELKKIEAQLTQQQIDATVATSSNSAASQAQKAILEIEKILNKNTMFSMAAMDPEINALKEAERARLYALRGLDPRTLNMVAAGISGGQQPAFQGFSSTIVSE